MRPLNALRAISAGLVFLSGCGGGTEPDGTTGLRVTVTTTGSELDPDGYSILLDGGPGGSVAVNGNAVLSASAGQHTLALAGLAGNCSVTGDQTRTESVTAGELTQVPFAVTCVQSGANARYLGLGPSLVALVAGEETALRVALYDSQGNPVPFASRTLFTWTSSAPQSVTVSDTGLVRVVPGAAAPQTVTIQAQFDTIVGQSSVVVAPPAVAVHVVPSEVTFTPGGRLTLQALAETEAGDLFSGYLVHFAMASGAAHLQEVGCSLVDCLQAAPDAMTLFGDAPGTTTITATGAGRSASVPVTVRFASFSSVTAGGGHSCGLATDAVLFCWGGGFARTPVGVDYPSGLTSIQAGFTRTCGLDVSGLAICWPMTPDPVPAPVSSTVHFQKLALTFDFSCGLDVSGAAWCWGVNDRGQLGDGTHTASAAPVAVAGGHTFTDITVGGEHSCALTSDGAAWCWGMNFAGELGTTAADPDECAPYACSDVPIVVEGGRVFSQIVAGAYHTCALESGGAAWCWGFSDKRGAGSDTGQPFAATPVAVTGVHVFASLTSGPDHTCGLTTVGEAYCWGNDAAGRAGQPPGMNTTIGFGGQPVLLSPGLVLGSHTFSQLDAGGSHTCGLATDGVYCWGENGDGQVGIFEGSSEQPVRVTGQP